MNYQPVVIGNQPNSSADPQNTDADTTFEVKETESAVHVSPSSRVRNLSEEFEDFSSNSTNGVDAASTPVTAVEPNSTNNTNTFTVVGPSNNSVSLTFEFGGKSSFVDPSQYPDDLNMPALEDITYSDDEEDVGAEADFSNLETNITVSPILTTRVHKDHPVTQIIGNLSLAPQTRSVNRMVKDQSRLTQINDKDFHTCMFVSFLSQEEPKRVHQALKDPSWIEAMQEVLLQFKMQKVWVLVDLPKGKRVIGSKWVFRNKKDERGIVVRNKARLVAHGHTQEEGIDYEEVFAPVARIEAIRLFLDYASFMGFMVYQIDVKSALLYGTIEEELYVCQPPGFEDPDYSDKVYKVVKALYGLHQALRAWKFCLTDGKSASIPIDTEKPLLKNLDGEDVDTVVAISSTEAEYVAAVSCYAQVLWIQNQLLDYGLIINDVSSKLLLFGLMIDVVHLMLSGHKDSAVGTNDVVRLQALLYKRKVIFTEDTVRQALQLDDADSIDCLPNEEIFAELARTEDEDAANEISAEPTPPSPIPATTPPPQQELIPLPSQVKSTLPPSPHQSLIAQPSSPPPQQPSQPEDISHSAMDLLNQFLETCTTLTKKVSDLEKDKIAQAIEITKLKQRVRRVVTTAAATTDATPNTAATTITAAPMPKDSAPRRRRGARKNMMVYLKNMAGFKMEFFKGMTYTDIRPIFKKHFNSIVAFLEKGEKEIEEEASKQRKWKSESSEQKAAKKQRIDEKMILLVERRYPLTRFTLDQILNNVRLEVEEESEVSLDLLRFVRRQQQEGYKPE
nr:putative ribonuclease H-like domain-containing protein [Tanacetum cinerariifolium]